METILIEPQFLPPIEYFTRLKGVENICLDIHHHYQKQTYRNRCYIQGANKIERLTVPAIAPNHTPFKNVEVSYDMDWSKIMWRSLASAYANSPFYMHYAEGFEKIISKKHTYLLDLNMELLTLCLKVLNLNVNISFTENYVDEAEEPFQDLRSVITPKQSFSTRHFYQPIPYHQLFGTNFEANLSIIDLIFCEGPNAQGIVTKSTIGE